MSQMTDSEYYYSLLRAYIDSANDGIFVLCDEMKFLVANPLLASWLGTSEDNLTEHNRRRPITDFIGNEENAQKFQRNFETALTGLSVRFECFVHPAGAAARQVEISLSKVDLEAGEMFIGIARDISERNQTERALQATLKNLRDTNQALEESEQRFHRMISEAPIPIMIHAEDGEVMEVNKVWTEISGYSRADLPTIRSWVEKAYGSHAQQVMRKIASLYALDHRVDQGEFTITCKDGSSRHWHFSAAPAGKLPDGRSYVISTAEDISERKAAQKQIEFLAYHDALTGLPNRLLAQDRYELAASYADREKNKVALVFLDLDNFKIINDSLGHAVGDALLTMVATRLRKCLRDTDTLSRQGGDEFLILLGGMVDFEAISVVVEMILTRLIEPFAIEGNELSTSLSIGIAVYPDDGEDYDTLLKKADTAMYQSKDAGRNTYRFFTEQMNVDAVEHLQIRNNLRKGLKRGEFVLHYQPQIDLGTNAVIGAEALIRWNHPQLGMVLPGRFITIAEESALIVPLGEWILLEACRQAVAWRKAGLPELVMAVNLSSVQFKRGNLEKSVIHALSASGLDPTLLELELTESILIQDAETVLGRVQRLKSLGVKLSIDDFGTGYSSLSYLKRFSVDKLKIDRSFIRDMTDDPNDAVIVRTIIQMARNLNLKTVAEGVETERQAELLRLQHCDEAQGYHFARPMPADEFERYLSAIKPPA